MAVILCKDFQNAVYNLIINNLIEQEGMFKIHNSLTLGFLDEGTQKIVGGTIFSLCGVCCYITIWSDDVRWCSRSNLANILEVGFELGAVAIKCATNFHNYKANKLSRGLGFRKDGVLRFQRPNGQDEIIWSITKKEMESQKWWKSIRYKK